MSLNSLTQEIITRADRAVKDTQSEVTSHGIYKYSYLNDDTETMTFDRPIHALYSLEVTVVRFCGGKILHEYRAHAANSSRAFN